MKTWRLDITNFGCFTASQCSVILSMVPDYVGSSGNDSYFCFFGFKTLREAKLCKRSIDSFLDFIGFKFIAKNAYDMDINVILSVEGV